MAHTRKYSTTYCDVFGRQCQVFILERDYTGVVTELSASPEPFLITYESGSDFKFDTIRSSSAIVNFILDDSLNLDEIFSADERKYKLEHYIDNVLDWVGYVLPNGYSYNFTGGKYEASLEATDGLTSLDSFAFLDDNLGVPYGTSDLTFNNEFLFPFILIATEILRKLDLDLNLWSCVDVYEQSMQKTGDREADPLANAFVNVKSYIGDSDRTDRPYWREPGEVFNCREVMENLLNIFSAKLYQSEGVWRIKRINVDAEYGTGPTQRYWRKYNTLSVYIGQEIVNKEDTVPCHSIDKAFIENDHVLSADEVYKAFRVNYDYTFIRDGDSPVALIDNVGFNNWDYNDIYSAPEGWKRFSYRIITAPHILNRLRFPALDKITIPANEEPNLQDGFTTAIEFDSQNPAFPTDGTLQDHTRFENRLRYRQIEVKKGNELRLEFWAKYSAIDQEPYPIVGTVSRVVAPAFQISLHSDGSKVDNEYFGTSSIPQDISGLGFAERVLDAFLNNTHTLQNNFPDSPERGTDQLSWVKDEPKRCFTVNSGFSVTDIADALEYKWRKVEIFIPAVPDDGILVVDIFGLVSNRITIYDSFFELNVKNSNNASVINWNGIFSGTTNKLQLTGLSLGFIPDENNYAEITDYIYENPKPNYTLQVDPIEVLNGDTLNETHISSIIVPTNTTGRKNFWDTLSDAYGKSSIGLIAAKSIMNLYFCPLLILEGTIKAPNATFDTRYTFEALPNRKFVLQRGSFFRKLGYIQDATFVEVTNEILPLSLIHI